MKEKNNEIPVFDSVFMLMLLFAGGCDSDTDINPTATTALTQATEQLAEGTAATSQPTDTPVEPTATLDEPIATSVEGTETPVEPTETPIPATETQQMSQKHLRLNQPPFQKLSHLLTLPKR